VQDTEGNTVVKRDLDFQKTYLEGLFLLFKEASGQGLLAEYEDLVDTIYAIFPTDNKRTMTIYDIDGAYLSPVLVEWKKALAIGPPVGDEALKGSGCSKLKVQVRQRCLRKVQIVTDVAKRLKLIGEEYEDVEMGEDSDVFKKVHELAGQVR
jgi:hypothetical protein